MPDLFAIVRSVITMLVGMLFLYIGYIFLAPIWNGVSNAILSAQPNLTGLGQFVSNIDAEISASFIMIGIVLEVYGFASAFRRESVPT